jgi:hypothetical protein
MNPTLADLVKKKQSQSVAEPIDWSARLVKYLDAVDGLYRQIETAFQEAIAAGSVRIHKRPRAITERYIGSYSATDLILIIGQEQVQFVPRGRVFAGTEGRVDVIGERAEAMIVFLPGSGWGIVEARQPTLRTTPFTESTFAELLREIMGD